MSYQVLARKWRPKSFDQLVGQEQTARALINALDSQRLHHAYLFTGTRGVGKTTIARIFSKSLNCEQGITSSPCGQCSSCVEIDEGRFVDLVEIDAASKTGVDDMRELIENVQYKPTRGRYKVYLIDEVHMLSTSSFNALLKTLEEPPPHVVFLLATTDPQKLLVTVLSRCLQFHLKRMETESIVEHLAMILEQESIDSDQASIEAIAKAADGSMRDALSLLDQAIVFSGDQLNIANVQEMLGSIEQHFIDDLLDKIIANDASGLLQVVKTLSQYSPDYIEVMNDWLSLLHRIAVTQTTNQSSDDKIQAYAQQISPADLQLFYQLSLQAKKDLPFAPSLRQGFEMAMLRIISFKPNFYQTQGSSESKKKSIEKPVEKPSNSVTASASSASEMPQSQINRQSRQTLQSGGMAQPVTTSIVNQAVSLVAEIASSLQKSEPQQRLAEVIDIPVAKERVENEQKAPSQSEKSSSTSELKVNEPASVLTESDKIAFQQINQGNWSQVIKQMAVAGTGLQVLLNSLPEVKEMQLLIQYSEKMQHLITDNLKLKLQQGIQAHFSDPKISIDFVQVDDLKQTPKEQQTKKTQAKIEQIYQQLNDNQCLHYILQETEAKFTQQHITLLSDDED